LGEGWIANRPQETELGERIVLHQFGMTAKDPTGGLQVHCKPVDLTVAKNSLGLDMAVDSNGDRFATLNLSFVSREDFIRTFYEDCSNVLYCIDARSWLVVELSVAGKLQRYGLLGDAWACHLVPQPRPLV